MPDPITMSGAEPDPAHVAAVSALAHCLIGAAQTANSNHGMQLDGLLSAYASLLMRHPCCWAGAHHGLQVFTARVGEMVARQAADIEQQAALAIARAAHRPAA